MDAPGIELPLAARPDEPCLQAQHEAAQGRLARVEEELNRLTVAIASGRELPSGLQAVKERKHRREQLRTELAAREGRGRVIVLDLRETKRDLRERLQDWGGSWAATRHELGRSSGSYGWTGRPSPPRRTEEGASTSSPGRDRSGDFWRGRRFQIPGWPQGIFGMYSARPRWP